MSRPEHIQYIIDKLGKELEQTLIGEGCNTGLDQAIETFLRSDPTEGKRLTDWMVKTYINRGFYWEDVESGEDSKLYEVLSDYKNSFSMIPKDSRNIYQYRSYGELYKMIKPHLEAKNFKDKESKDGVSNREVKRREREKALSESIVLHRSNQIIVAVPLTEFASCWWGKGTKWCTAAENRNYFHRYNENAPLIVCCIQDTDGTTKLQFQASVNSVQFMDETDSKVSSDQVLKHWNVLQPILEWGLTINPETIDFIPYELRTREMCSSMLAQSPWNTDTSLKFLYRNNTLFQYVPEEIRDYEMCKLAIRENANAFHYVPSSIKDSHLFALALQNTNSRISPLSKEMFDTYGNLEMLEWCAINNPAIIGYIEEYQTPELLLTAINHSKDSSNPINFYNISESLLTPEICLWAVQSSRVRVSDIPKQLCTSDVYKVYIENNPGRMEDIPAEDQTSELWVKALKGSYYSKESIPSSLFTPRFTQTLYQEEILHKYYTLVDPNTLTYEMCRHIVGNGNGLYRIPSEFIDYDLCLEAVKNCDHALSSVPKHLIDPKMCWQAIEIDGYQLENVPSSLVTEELCKYACENNGWALKFVPGCFKTPELCRIALKTNNLSYEPGLMSLLREIPPEFCDQEMYELARSNPDSYSFIPEQYRTSLVHAIRVQEYPEHLEQVPPDILDKVQHIIMQWQEEEEKLRVPRVKWDKTTLTELEQSISVHMDTRLVETAESRVFNLFNAP